MSLPPYFPDPERSQRLIDDLLDRVRKLDSSAKQRLSALLEDEADLPMLDKLERSYRDRVQTTLSRITDQDTAVELGNALRAHFNRNLALQREFLHSLVRKTLLEELAKEEESLRIASDEQ